MALNVIEGLVGAGKTYVAVHRWMAEFLRGTDRHIYTNLPVNVDNFVCWLTTDSAKRIAYKERIHFLDSVWVKPGQTVQGRSGREWSWPLDEETGKPLEMQLCGLDQKTGLSPIRHFWRFTPANAVILMDEVADHWGTTIWKELSEGELGSFINHHRHYKYDLFFFVQNKDDIATSIRKKIDCCWLVENSLRRNMLDFWIFRGLKWPIQFFYVRMDLGAESFGVPYLTRVAREPQQNFIVFPCRRGFKNYDSFCQSTKLSGKVVADDAARSGDMPTLWNQVSAFVSSSWIIIALLGGICVGGFVFWNFISSLLSIDSKDVAGVMYGEKTHKPVAQVWDAPTVVVGPNLGDGAMPTVAADSETVVPQPERLILSTPERAISTKGKYEIGDQINVGGESRRIRRVLLDGVQVDGGGRIEWAVVFQSRTNSGAIAGATDQRAVGGVGVALAGAGDGVGHGDVGRP